MAFGDGDSLTWVVALLSLAITMASSNSVSAMCEFSVVDHDRLYSYSLALPIPKYPHGVLSEDGFYKVEVNETVLWFQLCDAMIFNHNPPTCFDCQDYGGPSRCGMGCGVLVSNKIAGYPVCTTIEHTSMGINLIGKLPPKTRTIYNSFGVQERRIHFAQMVVFLLVWLLACWYCIMG